MRTLQYIGTLVFGIVAINAYFIYSKSIAEDINESGISYLNKGEYFHAIKTLEKASRMSGVPKDLKITILRNLAVAYEQNRNFNKAIEYYDKAGSITKKATYMYYICRAEAAMLSGNINIAIENLNSALEKNKEEFAVYNNLGLIYLGSYGDEYKNPLKAVKFNIKAFELCNDTIVQFILGKNYFELNDFEKAEFHLSKVTAKVPNEPKYHYYLGLTLFYLGKNEEAVQHLKSAVKMNPDYETEETKAVINFLEPTPDELSSAK